MLDTIRTAWGKPAALIRKEPFFFIMLLLTLVCSLFSKPHMAAVKWNVILLLFSLMLIGLAFEKCFLLISFARFSIGMCKTPRKLGFAMILVTGILAMFVTNDVALLTVVPLTMTMAKLSGKDPFRLIVLETMAANIFSALTPIGNPQNLYLYSYYQIQPVGFFAMMVPFCLFGALLLFLVNYFLGGGEAYRVETKKFEIRDGKLLAGAAMLFLSNILSVLRVIDYRVVFLLTVAAFLVLAPRLFLKIDYTLLLTFVLFFLFTDSVIGLMPAGNWLTELMDSKTAVLLSSAVLSQFISNVPTAVLLSGFTLHAKELLYGVSAGGLGTLIASLASLISYKLYIREYRPANYLKLFYLLNFGMLIVLLAAAAAIDTLL